VAGAFLKTKFYVADWLVEPELNCITRNKEAQHLEPKVMRVLLELASHPNQVLSKEELIRAVWPDTFVSDDVLTRCISVLRRAMNDSPQAPRVIQTIPKAGYRLVAEVHSPAAEEPAPAPPDPVPAPPDKELETRRSDPGVEDSPVQPPPDSILVHRRTLIWAGAIFLFLIAATLTWSTLAERRHARMTPAFRTLPLTSYAGEQSQPAFSPDGKRVAFVWTEENESAGKIYIKQLGSEALVRLTNLPEEEYSPVWSPDGRQIAFLARSDSDRGIYVVPSLGGPPRKIYTPRATVHWEQGALSWSPDGKSLLFPDIADSQVFSSIYQLALDTMKAQPVTYPPAQWEGDVNPHFSPDGKRIAFIRAIEGAVRDIYIMPASGGAAVHLTHDSRNVDSFAWASDGQSVLFSSDRGGKYALWQVSLRKPVPQRLPFGTEDAFQPAVAPAGDSLAYTESSAIWSIVNIGQDREDAVVSSTQQDSAPSFSPDGTRFAFQSWRSGNQEIWVASFDGTRLQQLTFLGDTLAGSPTWSRDGQQIAFDARPGGHSHIYIVPAAGGTPREITFGDANDILPRWSKDGHFIYFSSNRSGKWQIWKVRVNGGNPQPITASDGFVAAESVDGKWIYFAKNATPGIWRIPSSGGAEMRVLDQPRSGYWGYWSLTARGIYFLDLSHTKPAISIYDPRSGKISHFANLEHDPPPYSGISVYPNGPEVLITDERNAGSHITAVEGLP
jgi:Tol biopolymer transport system component/DNA-binding winged helix-turn-helix (wHTH) protein